MDLNLARNPCIDVLKSIRDDHNAVCLKFPLGVCISLRGVTVQMNKFFGICGTNNKQRSLRPGKRQVVLSLLCHLRLSCAAEGFAVHPDERKVLIATAAFQQYVQSFTCTFKLSLSYSSIFRSYLTSFPFGQ